MPRYAARADKNQAQIVEQLRQLGYECANIREPVDYLVSGYSHKIKANITIPVDFKSERGKLTQQQIKFISKWKADVLIAYTVEDVLDYFGAIR